MTGPDQAALMKYDDIAREVLDLLGKDDSENVLAGIDRLIAIDETRPESFYFLGLVALEMNEQGRALELFEKAAGLDPDCFEYAEALANLYTQLGRLNEGLFYAKLSMTLMPHPTIEGLLPVRFSNYFMSLKAASPSANYLRGLSPYTARRFSDSIRHFDRELKINPNNAECLRDYGDALCQLGRYTEALQHLSRAVELQPNDVSTRFKLGNLCYRLGEFEEAPLQHKAALDLDRDSIELAAAVFARTSALPPGHTKIIEELHKNLQRRLETTPDLPPEALMDESTGTGSDEEKIRLGYISNRFMFSDQARMVEPLLQLHDRQRFHVTVYQQSHGGDSTTQRLRASADNLRYVGNLDDELLAVVIAGDQIDILVDLCVDDVNNRATVLQMHPAKVQVGAWGTGMGLGMPGIDYILTDDITDEATRVELRDDQKIHKLDFGLLSYQPRKTLPAVGDLPLKKNGAPTIGVSCDAGAIMRGEAEILAEILNKIPQARIIVGAAPAVDQEAFNRIKFQFNAFGLADRIHMSSNQKYADQMIVDPDYWNSIDVFVDVGRRASPIVIADSLWMGVPVLSLKGQRPFDRLGASVVYTAARPGWIADTQEDLIKLTVDTLSDIDVLSETRKNLRNEMRQALLFNPEPHVRSVERAYLQILGREVPAL
tara:strand:+ start:4679 stop:6655 length:1977 start_codon:yes stop_codon:yes gene_type:complete